jgi:hypothetical protein
MVTSCYHFDTTNPNFHESSPNKYYFLSQRSILEKFIGRVSDSMD